VALWLVEIAHPALLGLAFLEPFLPRFSARLLARVGVGRMAFAEPGLLVFAIFLALCEARLSAAGITCPLRDVAFSPELVRFYVFGMFDIGLERFELEARGRVGYTD
jgi:hypothetical protein